LSEGAAFSIRQLVQSRKEAEDATDMTDLNISIWPKCRWQKYLGYNRTREAAFSIDMIEKAA
jgi:hypothetical protein